MSTMRELKGRIGSVQSSQKITSAMKMISSAKLRKAEIALKHVVPFRDQIQSTINNLLGADSDYQSPLTEQRPVQRDVVRLLSFSVLMKGFAEHLMCNFTNLLSIL